MSSKKRKYREKISSTMGGAMVGFDYQVFRTTPPPHESVHAGEETRGLSGEDGELRIGIEELDEAEDVPPADEERPRR